MRRALAVVAWVIFAIDVSGALLFLVWSLAASSRDGEQAYAIVAFLVVAFFLAIGGAGLGIATWKKSAIGIGCAGVLLGVPGLIVLVLVISDRLGL